MTKQLWVYKPKKKKNNKFEFLWSIHCAAGFQQSKSCWKPALLWTDLSILYSFCPRDSICGDLYPHEFYPRFISYCSTDAVCYVGNGRGRQVLGLYVPVLVVLFVQVCRVMALIGDWGQPCLLPIRLRPARAKSVVFLPLYILF